MTIELCPLSTDVRTAQRCFEERQKFTKGASWTDFRAIFGPFLSGRRVCDEGWRKDRKLFENYIRDRMCRLREHRAMLTEDASSLSYHDITEFQRGVRILLLKAALAAFDTNPEISRLGRIADFSQRLGRTADATDAQSIGAAVQCELAESLHKSGPLMALATEISEEDPKWLWHTAWQILFASVESTSLAVEGALAVYLGRLPVAEKVLRPADAVRCGLFHYPSTYNMTFDLQTGSDLFPDMVSDPTCLHVAVDKINKNAGRGGMPGSYAPFGFSFGGGPRLCPGRNIALAEAGAIFDGIISRTPEKFAFDVDYVRSGFFAHFVWTERG